MDIENPSPDDLQLFLLQLYAEHKFNEQVKTYNDVYNKHIENFELRLKKVTPELFTDYLAEKGISSNCVLCGKSALSVPEGFMVKPGFNAAEYNDLTPKEQLKICKENTLRYVRWTNIKGRDDLMDRTKNVYYTMHCLHCGNLTMIRALSVLEWCGLTGKDEA